MISRPRLRAIWIRSTNMADAPMASCGACWSTHEAAPASDGRSNLMRSSRKRSTSRITARAQDQSFSVTLQRDFGEGIAPITLAPQDVTRVLLNLYSNGFYA